MTHYILTQEQLDRLQKQLEEVREIHHVKERRIRELESRGISMSDNKAADLMETIFKLEDEIRELKKENRQLLRTNSVKENAGKIQELQMLLNEERKLREYSEAFAKQIEMRRAEETLIKDLTTELCQLQRAEIELGNKKIDELQKQFKVSPNETNNQKEMIQIGNTRSKESFKRNTQLKIILEELKAQLSNLYRAVERKPSQTQEDQTRVKEMENWLKEIDHVMADLSVVEDLRKDLQHLKSEIELRKRFSAG